MASPSAVPENAPPTKSRSSWQRLPWILLGGVVFTLAGLYVRGTWGSGEPLNPTRVEQGPVSRIYLDPQMGPTVRAAILLPHPPERVWALITAYGKYDEMFGYLKNVTIERQDSEETKVQGQAMSAFGGWWDFAICLRERKDGTTWTASWDHPGGSLRVNRGRWTVAPADNGQTLLALQLEAQFDRYPTFFLRDIFLTRLKQALLSAANELSAPDS